MTDIVDRLRDKHCCDDACHCDEAAAEIERLRAAVEWAARWSIYKPGKTDGTAPDAETALRSIAWHPVIRAAQPAAPGGDND